MIWLATVEVGHSVHIWFGLPHYMERPPAPSWAQVLQGWSNTTESGNASNRRKPSRRNTWRPILWILNSNIYQEHCDIHLRVISDASKNELEPWYTATSRHLLTYISTLRSLFYNTSRVDKETPALQWCLTTTNFEVCFEILSNHQFQCAKLFV